MMQTLVQSGGIKFKVRQDTTAAKAATTSTPAEKPKEESKPSGAAPTAEAEPTKKRAFKVKAAPEEQKPIDSLSRKELLERFYKGRVENPEQYTYGPDGNLVILDATGKPTKTIPMMKSCSLTADEVVELTRERAEEVRVFEVGSKDAIEGTQDKEKATEEKPIVSMSYVDALANLRDVYAKYKRGETGYTARAVKDANVKVQEALALRGKALYPIKYVKDFRNPKIKTILIDSKDDRHIGYDVYVSKHYSFKKQDAFGHYITPEEEAEQARKTTMQGGSAIDVILIESYDDPARGFLHPAYTKDFAYTSTQYSSVYQAFEVERLKIVRNQALVDQLMKTRSPRTIASLAAQDKTAVPNSYDLWFSILKAFYQQNTDLAKQLLETGSSIFSLRDTTISSPSDYLNALMAVRAFLAEKQEGGAAAPVEKHVITEEEQKKAKVAAIINARRAA